MFLDRREQSTKVRGGFSLHLHSSLDFVGLGSLQTMHTVLSEEHTEKKNSSVVTMSYKSMFLKIWAGFWKTYILLSCSYGGNIQFTVRKVLN